MDTTAKYKALRCKKFPFAPLTPEGQQKCSAQVKRPGCDETRAHKALDRSAAIHVAHLTTG